MANFISNWFQSGVDAIAKRTAMYLNDDKGRHYAVEGAYYDGDHRKPLKPTVNKETGQVTDDNVIVNFVKLAVNRSVSRMYRGGIKFVLPDGADAQQEYLDRVWDLNKKEILLYQDALQGTVYGTHYIKIMPDGKIDPYTDKPYPRLVALEPELIRVKTDPQDKDEVLLYQIRYKIGETAYYEITRRADVEYTFGSDGNAIIAPRKAIAITEAAEYQEYTTTWKIDEWEQSATYGNQLTMTRQTEWQYDFPPIIHAKNLPSLRGCYGDSDIDDAIATQDKVNFTVSNTGKIIKFHAHPEVIGTGFSVKDMQQLDSAVGTFRAIPNPDAKVFTLEMQSDLASSNVYALARRQEIFDLSREVDISSMADKLGALTNFGLQVLWSDSIDKNDTKRQLYGDFLLELNRRLLVLANFTLEASNPGTLQWGNPLPININEEMQADKTALEMGIIDKETVAKRYQHRYGKEWEDIQAALQDEQNAANQGNADIGALILRNFNRGGGAENMPPAFERPGQVLNNQTDRAMMKGNGTNGQ